MSKASPSLRFYIHSQLIATVLLCSLISTAGVYVVGEILFGSLYARARASAYSIENHNIRLFDTIAGNLEANARSRGARALVELGTRYSSPDSLSRATAKELEAEASRLGVGEIYLIGPEGRVVETTFAADRGLDLFSLGGEFKAFLLDILGKGRVTSQSLSLSTRTGNINMYQYYSPPGSKVIIETSTSLRRLLSQAFPGIESGSIVAQLFDLSPPDGDGRLVWLTDIATFGPGNIASWSLLKEGSPSGVPAEALAEAAAKGESRRVSGDRELLVKVADLERRDVDFFNARFLAVFSIDLRPIRNYRRICLLAGLGIAALISLASLIRARRSFTERVTKRVEAIVRNLKEMELGPLESALEGSSGDEITAIGQGVYAMVSALMEKNRELGSLSRRLEEEVEDRKAREERLSKLLEEKKALILEVHHRVRNNLQILSSLVALQVQGNSDQAVQDALHAILIRILGMSLAHDQLYESATMKTVDVGRYLGNLARSIVDIKKCGDKAVAVTVDARGLELSSDVAVPLGLAVGELIANSCDHAFPDRSAGKVEIRVEESADELRVAVTDDGVGFGSTQGGLGLDIVKALCLQLNGSLKLETGSLQGNTILILIPLPIYPD
jgi:two-component sensor histidine kinase